MIRRTAPPRRPTRRTVLGLGVGAAVAAAAPAAGGDGPIDLPRHRSEVETFPVLPIARPACVPRDEGLLFFVQQSINANVIVFTANRGADGTVDADRPIEVFWRRYQEDGRARALTFFERMFAFGVATMADGRNRWSVRLVSFPERDGRFEIDAAGRPTFTIEIAGEAMRPVYVHAELIDDGFIPTFVHVDVWAVADGRPGYVRERIHFG